MTTRIAGTDTAYPAEVTTDANGTVTSMRFFCAAHGNDVPCSVCDTDEVSAFRRASVYTAYIKGNDIVTFGGYKLARVKRLYLEKRRYTPTGGTYRMAYVTAESHGGVTWHGRYNYESTELITLRRSKRNAAVQ